MFDDLTRESNKTATMTRAEQAQTTGESTSPTTMYRTVSLLNSRLQVYIQTDRRLTGRPLFVPFIQFAETRKNLWDNQFISQVEMNSDEESEAPPKR